MQSASRRSRLKSLLACAGLAAAAAVSCAASPATEPAAAGGEVRVTYLGNEGFLVERSGHKVLIDALYRAGVPGYEVHSPELQQQLEWAREPFDGVDLVLATHVHNDHFDPGAVGKFLVENRDAVLVTTPQAADRLMRVFPAFSAIADRVQATHPPEGSKKKFEFGDIKLTVMTLHHGRDVPFQNLGFLIEIDGAKLLHLGDTQILHAEMGRFGMNNEQIDVAFVPFWLLLGETGQRMIRETIAPRKIVPMHVPLEDAPSLLFGSGVNRRGVMSILKAQPSLVVFDEPMQTQTID